MVLEIIIFGKKTKCSPTIKDSTGRKILTSLEIFEKFELAREETHELPQILHEFELAREVFHEQDQGVIARIHTCT